MSFSTSFSLSLSVKTHLCKLFCLFEPVQHRRLTTSEAQWLALRMLDEQIPVVPMLFRLNQFRELTFLCLNWFWLECSGRIPAVNFVTLVLKEFFSSGPVISMLVWHYFWITGQGRGCWPMAVYAQAAPVLQIYMGDDNHFPSSASAARLPPRLHKKRYSLFIS